MSNPCPPWPALWSEHASLPRSEALSALLTHFPSCVTCSTQPSPPLLLLGTFLKLLSIISEKKKARFWWNNSGRKARLSLCALGPCAPASRAAVSSERGLCTCCALRPSVPQPLQHTLILPLEPERRFPRSTPLTRSILRHKAPQRHLTFLPTAAESCHGTFICEMT